MTVIDNIIPEFDTILHYHYTFERVFTSTVDDKFHSSSFLLDIHRVGEPALSSLTLPPCPLARPPASHPQVPRPRLLPPGSHVVHPCVRKLFFFFFTSSCHRATCIRALHSKPPLFSHKSNGRKQCWDSAASCEPESSLVVGGAWSTSFRSTISCVAGEARRASDQRISCTLPRENARAILKRMPQVGAHPGPSL